MNFMIELDRFAVMITKSLTNICNVVENIIVRPLVIYAQECLPRY